MKKVELLLPAGNKDCLRAAVANGADAVYLGLSKFNARRSASNFNEGNIESVIKFCHDRKVKVYITLNTLVKNHEIKEFLRLVSVANEAKADAVIIQDSCLIDLIKKNFPKLKIHLSTQATITNSSSIPEKVDRTILARELTYDEIKEISSKYETEIFIHGALCLCYSGQCLFSSFAGARSGNRGFCSQPCRQIYNNKYPLSTMDLCLIKKIPELIEAGISSFKIEGRLRSPYYVATVAKIYRKAIDSYYKKYFYVDDEDIDELMLAFNREFTEGFAFNNSIIDSRKPMNRGLFLGLLKKDGIKLNHELEVGDGIAIWLKDDIIGFKLENMIKDKKSVKKAKKGDIIQIPTKKAPFGSAVYKTSSLNISFELGDELKIDSPEFHRPSFKIPEFHKKSNPSDVKLFVKVYNKRSAIEADNAKADIIYYDLLKDDVKEVKKLIKNARFFVFTPRIVSEKELQKQIKLINSIKPDGILVGNKGFLRYLSRYELHRDYSFNSINDLDITCYKSLPIISPELNFEETTEMHNKNFIVLIHGDIILMTTKESLKHPELIDKDNRKFKTRKLHDITQVLNNKQLGLFNKAALYPEYGIKFFMIDLTKEVGKFVRIYKKILSGEKFDDSKIRKGYTTGHFKRGIF